MTNPWCFSDPPLRQDVQPEDVEVIVSRDDLAIEARHDDVRQNIGEVTLRVAFLLERCSCGLKDLIRYRQNSDLVVDEPFLQDEERQIEVT